MKGDRIYVAVPRLPNLKPPPVQVSKASPSSSSPKPDTPTTSSGSGASPSPPPDIQKRQNEDSELIRHEFDVYAKPFVPAALKDVNNDHAAVVSTISKHQIDYLSYIQNFAAKSFLPSRPVLPLHHHHDDKLTLIESTYFQYFSQLAETEYVAKRKESASFSMYMVQLFAPFPGLDNQYLYSITIPGLREDSPLIEVGDTVRLRQLWVDDGLKLITVSQRLTHPGQNPIPRNWQGIEYHASVWAVNRANEIIYVKIDGLVPTTMFFNILIPVKEKYLQAQSLALSLIAHAQIIREVKASAQTKDIEQLHGILTHMLHINDWLRRMLFPVDGDGVLLRTLRSVSDRGMFDPKLNYEQIQAVDDACENRFGLLPFLISGPPGTGKTKTIVEIAMQLLHHTKTTSVSHILICAPSDQAADTLTQRLRQYLTPKQLFRLIGPQRSDIEVPHEVLPYCYRKEGSQDMFDLPSIGQLMCFNVVVTSNRDATLLVDARVTNNDLYCIEKNTQSAFHPEQSKPPESLHWGALLVDESAQATELEILPAICVVMPPVEFPTSLTQPRLIMAGDENQLGPRTASRDSKLETSLFSRLFQRQIYASHPLARSNKLSSLGAPVLKASMLPLLYPPFANLVRNYRSHPSIISVPSSLFYADTLIPEAPPENTAVQNSSLWCGKKWPVLFVPITAPDEIERDGGGWYNITEAREACDIAQHLVNEGEVIQEQIFIMSPFAAQVRKIRSMIRSRHYGEGRGLWDVNIGPLEAFQGLEGRIVILCTTRTRQRFLEEDIKRGLGIVGMKKRMNVALTRAKAGLIVLGNPHVLSTDEYWRAWLAFCSRNELIRDGSLSNDLVHQFKDCKAGVLEKALLFKAKKGSMNERVLGSATASSTSAEDMGYPVLIAGLDELGFTSGHEQYDYYSEGGND